MRATTNPHHGVESEHRFPAELGTILSLWAHPDDETYLSAGVMAAARDRGQRVVCATASAGEHGTADPDRWPPERLAAVRCREAAAAMAALGVEEHDIAGLPDGGLGDCSVAGEAWARRLIDTVRPDTILTFGPDGMTFHPDHIAVHRWVTDAWLALGRPGRLWYATVSVAHLERFGRLYEEWGIYMTDARPSGVPAEQLALDLRLTGAELDRKVVALRALASQTAEAIEAIGLDLYTESVADEAFVDASRTLDQATRNDSAAPATLR